MNNSIKEVKTVALFLVLFIVAFLLPVESGNFQSALLASFDLIRWYAREHVVMCLLIAFLIAGIISIFFSQEAILKYLGAKSKKIIAYSVASISGSILSVCSCTILPLFTSIYKKGAGLGPAIAFLFSGPAINIMAIILSMKILGVEIGIARAISAICFSVIIGLLMELIFFKEEKNRQKEFIDIIPQKQEFEFWKIALLFITMILILIFANWGHLKTENQNIFNIIFKYKWHITGIVTAALWFILYVFFKISLRKIVISGALLMISALIAIHYFSEHKLSPLLPVFSGIILLCWTILTGTNKWIIKSWIFESWNYAKMILPLLGIGVLIAGFLFGSKHDNIVINGIIPEKWISNLIGGNSLLSTFIASVIGSFMYFATLTEVPIVMGLMAMGMGKGPALALLLAGPSLSLPNVLVIRKVLGNLKTFIYVFLNIIMATVVGYLYGNLL
ncbi:MAG: permease [Bacteroidales bacterium]|nr:permease [Bacteroidales bacterium]